jgi:hypothetical protein
MSEVVLSLNYGTLTKFRVSPEAPESYKLHYMVPPPGGGGIDYAGSLTTIQYLVEQFFPAKIKDLEQLIAGIQHDIDWLRQGYCIAVCKSGTGLYDYTCEGARERCELWQGGFVRFVTLDELQNNLVVTQDVLSKVSADYEALKAFFAQNIPKLTVTVDRAEAYVFEEVWVSIGGLPQMVQLSIYVDGSLLEKRRVSAPSSFLYIPRQPGKYRFSAYGETTGETAETYLNVLPTPAPTPPAPPPTPPPPAPPAPPPTPPTPPPAPPTPPTPTPTPPTEVKPVPVWALVGLGLAVATVVVASRRKG